MKKYKKWLKEEITEILLTSKRDGTNYFYYRDLKEKIYNAIDQLDEPEALSQEFIDKHAEYYEYIGHAVVPVDELQNLIVPKKELPAIPKYMAEYIEWFKNDFEHNFAADIDLIINLIQVSHKFSRREKIKSWISKSGNPQKLIDAYRWGYEVEEEPLYRARLKVVTSEFTASYLRTQSPDAEDRLKALEIGCRPILENYRHLSEFTEDELKRLDIWDSEQWKVEELEE